MLTLNFFLTISAYTAIVSVIIFIAVYSKMYNWYKNKMGLVMNSSLIANAIVAFGAVLRPSLEQTAMIVGIVGWLSFSFFLVWRLRILVQTAKEQSKRKLPQKDHNGERH